MRLLVSVSNAGEAAAALAGGADIIDAKDPAMGPLGAVTPEVFRAIDHVVGRTRPVTAALGDAVDEDSVERHAGAYAAAGATFVKLGFAGVPASRRVVRLLQAAVRGAKRNPTGSCGIVAVAYADCPAIGSITPDDLIDAAYAAGCSGVLLDTADKLGPALPSLLSPERLARWVGRAHGRHLTVALAGRLRIEDMDFVRAAGADIVGVRGAACHGGRAGWIDAERVRRLRQVCHQPWQSDTTQTDRMLRSGGGTGSPRSTMS
jgi:uncharacterized protein (UPF0264 family)